MNSTKIRNLEVLLTCPICFEPYEHNIISLPLCTHYFCKECCEKLMVNNQIKCSICNRINSINESLDSLKLSDQQLNDLIKNELFEKKDNVKEMTSDNELNYTNFKKDLEKISDLNCLTKKLKENKNKYKNIQIRIGFIGKGKAGKSTLINELRGKKKTRNMNDDDLAGVDVIQCTKIVKGYKLDKDSKILLCDVPGVGTPEFSKDDRYLKLIDFDSYDFYVLISNSSFTEIDGWLIEKIFKSKKPFAFVYSKIDETINSELQSYDDYNTWDQNERSFQTTLILSKLQNEFKTNIEKIIPNNREYKSFYISSLKPHRGYSYNQFNDLNNYIISEFNQMKKDSLILASKSLTHTLIMNKTALLKQRVLNYKESFNNFGIIKFAFIKIYSLFVNYVKKTVYQDIEYFKQVYGLNDIEEQMLRENQDLKKIIEKYSNIESYLNDIFKNQIKEPSFFNQKKETEKNQCEKNLSEQKSDDCEFKEYVLGNKQNIVFETRDIIGKISNLMIDIIDDFQTAATMKVSLELEIILK